MTLETTTMQNARLVTLTNQHEIATQHNQSCDIYIAHLFLNNVTFNTQIKKTNANMFKQATDFFDLTTLHDVCVSIYIYTYIDRKRSVAGYVTDLRRATVKWKQC